MQRGEETPERLKFQCRGVKTESLSGFYGIEAIQGHEVETVCEVQI